jgi:tetratricopeptide (TPR) repeat protein
MSGRNIINAKSLKKKLANIDAPQSIKQWLKTQFFRWVINNYHELILVRDENDFKRLVESNTIPVWFSSKKSSVTFYYINPQSIELLRIRQKTIEALRARLNTPEERKFYKLTVADVLQRWQKDHDRMLKQQARGFFNTDGSNLQQVSDSFVEFVGQGIGLRQELHNESLMMGHCIGTGGYGEQYAKAIEEKRYRIFSLRDANNRAHATLSFEYDDNGQLIVEQIKGKQNVPPVEKYMPTILAFLRQLGAVQHNHPDCLRMGLLMEKQQHRFITEVQNFDLLFNSLCMAGHLIKFLDKPSAALQWAALFSDKSNIEFIPQASQAMLQHVNSESPLPVKLPNQVIMDDSPQLWAMALGAVFVNRFGGDQYSLNFLGELNNDEHQVFAEILKRDWSISNRKTALETIQWLWKDGHLRGFSGEKDNARDLLAFDISRLIYVARKCLCLGYIDIDETWAYVFSRAQMAQDCFDSWNDFATSYVRGRSIWNSEAHSVEDEIKHFMAQPNCVWRKLSWNAYPISPQQSKKINFVTKLRNLFRVTKHFSFYQEVGDSYYFKDAYELAIPYYLKAYKLSHEANHTELGELCNDLAYCYLQLEKYSETIYWAQIAVKILPEFGSAYFNLATVWKHLEDTQKRLTYTKKAVQYAPNDDKRVHYLNNLGLCYKALAQYEESIQVFLQTIEIDPNYQYPYYNLGGIYQDIENYEQSIAYYKKYLSLDSTDSAAMNNLGVSLQRLGDLTAAKNTYEKVLTMNPPANVQSIAKNNLDKINSKINNNLET